MSDFDGSGTYDSWETWCTGALVSPTVFVVAAHCLWNFTPEVKLAVSFAPDLNAGSKKVVLADGFDFIPYDKSNFRDLGVVLLQKGGTKGVTPLKLPRAGHLETATSPDSRVLSVGYGASVTGTGRPVFSADGVRKVTSSPFSHLTDTHIAINQGDTAQDMTGVCVGDSGGPHFMESDPSTTVAVTSWANDLWCRSLTLHVRLDTAGAREYLGRFVTLP
jgi:hypothetical protein